MERSKREIEKKEIISYNIKVKNTDRAVGTKLSHYIFKNFGEICQKIN